MKQKRFGKKVVSWLLFMVMVLTTVNLPVFTMKTKAAEYSSTVNGTVGEPMSLVVYDGGPTGYAKKASGELPPGVSFTIEYGKGKLIFHGTPKRVGTYKITFTTYADGENGTRIESSIERTVIIKAKEYSTSVTGNLYNHIDNQAVYFVGSDENFTPGTVELAPGNNMPSGLQYDVDEFGRVYFYGTPNEIGNYEVTFNTKEYPDRSNNPISGSFTRKITIKDTGTRFTPQAPSITKFSNPTDLTDKSKYSLWHEDGGVAQKINFGKNKTWYIAGEDTDGSLVLMCDPVNQFGEDRLFTEKTNYDNETYINNKQYEGQDVYANHYGASDVRAYLNGEALDVFSQKEKGLITNPVIYTNSTGGGIYATSDKLYLAYGETTKIYGASPEDYITVGSNSDTNLNNGIKIGLYREYVGQIREEYIYETNGSVGSPYCNRKLVGIGPGGSYKGFWLRRASTAGDRVTNAYIESSINTQDISIARFPVVPALNMDISDVLFASTATAAETNAYFSDAMTLRMNGEGKIYSVASVYHDRLQVVKYVNDINLYVYILYNDGKADHVISKEITGNKIYHSDAFGLESFDNCKIWIEKYDKASNLTYAVMAEEPKYVVDNGLIYDLIEGDNGLEANLAGPFDMTGKIVVKSEIEVDGHKIPVTGVTADSVFRENTNITELDLSESIIRDFGFNAFAGCTSLKVIKLPNDLPMITDRPFLGCPLEYVNIPTAWDSISMRLFANCTVKQIEIPSSIKKLDKNVFLNCKGLESIIYSGTEKQWKALIDANCVEGSGNEILADPDLVVTCTHVHAGGTATCTKKAVCEDCGEGYGEVAPGNHNFSKYVSNANGTHKVICADCGTVQSGHDKDTCSGGTATCTAKAKCTKCKVEYGSLKAHTNTTTTTKATTSKDGSKVTKCSACGKVASTTTIAMAKTFTLAKTSYEYTGSQIKPAVTVKDSKGNTIATTNYTLTYGTNKAVGKGTVKVTFKSTSNYSGSKELSFKIVPKKTTIGTPAIAADGITVKWTKNTTGAGYYIYRSVNGASYTKVKTITSNATVSWKDTTAKTNGNKYQYKIIAYKTVSGTTYTSAASAIKTTYFLTRPTVTLANQASAIKVSWGKNAKATGYYVYKSTDGGKTYKKVKTVTSNATVSYTDTAAKTNGTKYMYKVEAYKTVSGTTYKSAVSAVKTMYFVSRPAISSLTNSAAGKMLIKWARNAKATGYEIQYSTSSSFTSPKSVTATGTTTTLSKTIGSLTKGKTYYVRIRSYKTVGTTKYYSTWSASKSIKIVK